MGIGHKQDVRLFIWINVLNSEMLTSILVLSAIIGLWSANQRNARNKIKETQESV